MAQPTPTVALELAGKLAFFAGGMETDFLIGKFVKEIASDGTITLQAEDGSESTIALSSLIPQVEEVTEIAVGGGLTPTNVGRWHAYETTQLLEPSHTYEFLMQKGTDDSVLLPTIAFTGKELIEDVPVTADDAGDGYDPSTEQNHLGVIHGATTSGGLTLHVAHKARAQGDTTDSLLIHFQSTTYRIHSLIRRPGIAGPKGDKGDPGDGATTTADNSIVPAKARADTLPHKREWRERFSSAHISAGSALPDLGDSNVGDVRVITTNVPSGLSFVDISAPTTVLTSAYAGDVMMVLMFRAKTWTRVGNILSGGTVIEETPGTPVVASAANLDNLLYRAGRLYRNKVLHYTDPSATYRDFATSDLPVGFTWGGVVEINPAASSVPDNRVIYTTAAGQFERKITAGGQTFWVVYSVPNWRGQAADNSDADHKVRAVGDVVFFGGKVQVAASYTARTPDRFQWEPVSALWSDSENTDRIPRNKLPTDVPSIEDIQQSALHVSILQPDGTSQPLSYMTARTLAELFQFNRDKSQSVRDARSPIGFQIEGYIKGFNSLANLRNLRINGAVARRGDAALTIEERIADGHFNLVGHPSNTDLDNIIGGIDQGLIAFAIEFTIDGVDNSYEVHIPLDTRPVRELPDRLPYIHPEYILDDIYRRISELQVQEGAQIWENVTTGQTQIAAISTASATGMAILSGTFDPENIPPEVVWGYTFTQATSASQRIVILARIPITAVDRQDQLDDRFRLQIARASHATVYTTVGSPIAVADDFYYLHVTGAEATPDNAIVFTMQYLTNPFRTVYNDLLGPRAIASIPGGGGGGGTDQQARTAAAAAQSTADAALPRAGGTMTGALTLSGDPAADLHASTKRYVDTLLATIRDNLLVDNPASPIAPTDANADKLLVRGGRLYENILHSAVNPQVTFRDFTQADWRTAVGDSNAEWGGAVQITSPANQHPANYGLYSIPGAHFLRRVGSAFPANYGEFTPANWRGPASSEDEADERVTAVGDITYFGGSVRVVTAFVAGTTRHRTWEPIESVPAEHSVTADKLADGVIREYADVAATPASGDRFFFTDENQPGDPLRFVQMATLATAMGVRTRFEMAVGASPATLPVGTYEISVLGKPGNAQRTKYVTHRIPLSDIPTTTRKFIIRADGADEFDFDISYNPTTRVFTYGTSNISAGNQGVVLVSIKAIGEA